jgi:signal transduction histidine kinase
MQDSAQLQQLSGRIVQAQEEERRRIARELHDEIAQTLTGVKLSLESLIAELPPGVQTRHVASQLGPRQRLGQSVALVEETLAQVGNLSLELRPAMLDDMGLVPALDWYIERFSQRTGIRVTLDSGGLEARLPGEAETAVYRIIQEAMTNAARHAAPRHVNLSLRSDGRGLHVRVEDDGRGFDVDQVLNATRLGLAQRHFGLVGIRERAALFGGQVQIDTSPGRGTRLVVELPGVLPRLGERLATSQEDT